MLSLLDSILLGIIQGLTEFLPVSSSGHLVIASNILGLKPDLAFITIVHFATLLAVLTFFFKDIVHLVKSFFVGVYDVVLKRSSFAGVYSDPYFKLAFLIIAGTIPTVIIALSLKDWFTGLFNSLFAVGCFLIVTAALLLSAEKFSKGSKGEKDMSLIDSIVVGIFQGLAVAPGISRSGSTVAASLFRGLNRPLAAKFSFLLSIPAVFGAALLELKDIMDLGLNNIGFIPLLAGVIAAFISGLFAIRVFIKMIENKKISIFAYYCLVIGVLIILTQVL
ncbi:MAG: undecaprenyl-diphosphate phosphatase [Gammaproteobacteria bacterium]|nr:undecaprenyl-diphosphate phosphatase [Gammaproteobacteria bacterium]